MPSFTTQYVKRPPVYQEAGSPVKLIYSPRYDENGVLDLTVTGQEDLYAYIQSHKESTDIHVLLDRFANGETDVLQRMQGFYGDVTDMPKTYAEVLNAVIVGEETFARLPVEVKQKFDNSFAVWLASMDKPDFAQRMGVEPPAQQMTNQQVQDFTTPSPTPSGVSADSALSTTGEPKKAE